MKKITYLLTVMLLLLGINLSVKAQSYVPLTLTSGSFNTDLIANGNGPASNSTNNNFDGAGNVFYSQDFNPGSTPPCGGLPNSGVINSVATPGVNYQLASYSGNNCLFLVNQWDNGVLTITNPGSFSNISICASSANAPGASADFQAQLNFSDGSNTIYTFTVLDWFTITFSPANYCIAQLGRYDMSGAGYNGCPNYPGIFDCPITLNSADKLKILTSITCTKTDASPQRCAIFAICGVTSAGAPPAVVANPATSITPNGFAANWNSAATATTYKLDVSTASDFSSFVSPYNNYDVGNVTTFTISGLSSCTTYYYRLRAANSNGQGPNSNIITTVTSCTPPAPVATPATSVASTSFAANWNSSATATGYYLDVATDYAFTSFVTGFNNLDVHNVLTYPVPGLTNGTNYYYRIRAYNGAGASGNSNIISVTPAAPVATAETSVTGTSFSANWNSSAGATGYYLDVANDIGFTSFVTGYNNLNVSNVTTYPISGLNTGTTYYYRIRAYNALATSVNSNIITALTAPAPPVATAATSYIGTSFNANWNSSPSATGYYLDVATDNGFTSYVSGYNNLNVGNVLTYPITGLTGSQIYYYRVRAYNAGGTSTNSNIVSTIPPPPVATAATNINIGYFNANWNPSIGATGYDIDVATDSAFAFIIPAYNNLNVGNVTTYSITGLISNVPYYYRVRAYNLAGTSGNSNIIKVKKCPIITWANPADIVYGTPLSGTQLDATANVPGAFVYSPISGTVLNAGTNQNLNTTFTPTDTADYIVIGKTVQINVLKANPVITWANPANIVYGTPLGPIQLNATTTIPGVWDYSPASGTILPAGTNQNLSVIFTPTDMVNYNVMNKMVQITVTKATPVITWANPADIVYGTPLTGTQLNATTTIPGTYVYSPVGGTVLGAGASQNLNVTFTPTDIVDYNVANKTVQINVTKASPVITWSNPADIVYGTLLSATQLNATTTIPGTWVYSPASGTVLPSGTNQNLNVTFTPTDITDYNVANKTVQINVTKASIVITWANPANIVYGTLLSGTQLNATTTIPGTFVYSPSIGAILPAGASQNLSVIFTPTDIIDYNVASKIVQITVTKATPLITWANPADIVYGTALSFVQLDATADVPGTFVYSPVSGTVLGAGASQNLNVTFTPTDIVDYNVANKTVQINVTKASPVITWANPADIVYGTPLSATQLNATTTIPGTYVYSPASGTVLPAGTNQNLNVTFTPTDITDYNVANKTVQINVTKASIVITWANPANIVYGTLLSGTQLNATTTIPGTWDYSPASGAILPVGLNQDLTVTFTPTDMVDYNIVTKMVQINVTKANPLITWANPADIVYGTPLSFVQLDANADVPGTFVYSPDSGTVLNAGANQDLNVTFTPIDIADYSVANATVHINVLKADPIITWANPANIVYGTPLSATQLDATANVPGTFVYSPVSGTVLNAGPNQDLTVTFTPTNIVDYNVVSKTVQINVIDANPVITWANPADIVYGTALDLVQLNATTTIPGTWDYSPASGAILPVGTNQNLSVTFTPTDFADYNVMTKMVQINVIKANPNITWSNPADIAYGIPLSNVQLNAIADIQGTFVYTPAAGTILNPGLNQNLTVTFTPFDIANYNIATKTVQINIMNAAPTVQAEITEFTHVHGTDFIVDWTRGNGAYCAVFVAKTDTGTANPLLNTNYVANSEFASGDQIGFTGWYCVFDGIGTSVNVTGLTPSTYYRVMVVEYNEYTGYKNYFTTTNSNDPLNVETLEPIGGGQANYYISPNGDGINDVWVVERSEELQNYDLYIFNNIGETLYHSLGYNNKWDATYNNTKLPSGTYYYIFKNGGNIVLKGYITVVR